MKFNVKSEYQDRVLPAVAIIDGKVQKFVLVGGDQTWESTATRTRPSKTKSLKGVSQAQLEAMYKDDSLRPLLQKFYDVSEKAVETAQVASARKRRNSESN